MKILKTLDTYCKENNFTYVLHAGTLLGAVRHQGFIPWDDDVDIAMTRNVFDEFEKNIIKSDLLEKGYQYQSNIYSNSYAPSFSKLRSDTMAIQENVPATQKGYIGPWVDIFPLDNIPNDKVLREKQFKKVYFYHKLINLFLFTRVTEKDKGINKLIKHIIESINEKLYKHYFFMDFLYKKRLYHMTKYNNEDCEYVAELGYMFHPSYKTFNKKIIKRKSLENLEHVVFEDIKLPIPANSHEILTTNYGDYMILPAKEDRETHQINYF